MYGFEGGGLEPEALRQGFSVYSNVSWAPLTRRMSRWTSFAIRFQNFKERGALECDPWRADRHLTCFWIHKSPPSPDSKHTIRHWRNVGPETLTPSWRLFNVVFGFSSVFSLGL